MIQTLPISINKFKSRFPDLSGLSYSGKQKHELIHMMSFCQISYMYLVHEPCFYSPAWKSMLDNALLRMNKNTCNCA